MKSRPKNFLPNSIRARLSLLFSVVFGAALISTNFFSFRLFTYAHRDDFDAFLFNHAVNLAASIRAAPNKEIIAEQEDTVKKRRLYEAESAYVILLDQAGKVVASSQNMVDRPPVFFQRSDFQAAQKGGTVFRTIPSIEFSTGEDTEQPYRLISRVITLHGRSPLLLQIAAPLTDLERESREFLYLLVVIILFTLVVSGSLGYLASQRAFSPVLEMAQRTAQIEMRSLTERIQVNESDSELKELARTFNQLLDRVEIAVSAQERFVADASHQLKTPLSIIRGELELLQQRTDHSNDVSEALRNMSQEVTQLIRLVENLLLLARMDAGLGEITFQTVRLDELVSESLRRLQYLANTKGVKLLSELTPYQDQSENDIDFEFKGDAELLRCLMENLIENAIKYSPADSQVTVRLVESRTEYTLYVSDRGSGISPAQSTAIFERFYRESLKATVTQGSGLGLSIAKKITETHGGSISVQSRANAGSTFEVRLKKT